MALAWEQVRFAPQPEVWELRDYRPNSTDLQSVEGVRIHNVTPVTLKVRVTTGPQGDVQDWWTPLGRPNDLIQPGEDVTSTGWRIAGGQLNFFSISVGQA